MDELKSVGAIMTNDHFVYTSGRHGDTYVNKDALYTNPYATERICHNLALPFDGDKIQTVIGPAIGGAILAQWTAHRLQFLTGIHVAAVYAEKNSDGSSFEITRGYDKAVTGKIVLVVEDIVTTGASARKVVEAVRRAGGYVRGVSVICNRGNVQPTDVGITGSEYGDRFRNLTKIPLESWDAAMCPLCSESRPINTNFGKGREFLTSTK